MTYTQKFLMAHSIKWHDLSSCFPKISRTSNMRWQPNNWNYSVAYHIQNNAYHMQNNNRRIVYSHVTFKPSLQYSLVIFLILSSEILAAKFANPSGLIYLIYSHHTHKYPCAFEITNTNWPLFFCFYAYPCAFEITNTNWPFFVPMRRLSQKNQNHVTTYTFTN